MELRFDAEQVAFRDEVRTWLSENAPTERRPDGSEAIREYDLDWQRTQFRGGWAGISWPESYGGRGASLIQQLIWYEEYGRLGLPDVDACFVALSHAGPTLIARATPEQQAAHLPAILRGDVVWCQGFSEPDAGSDLASLSTRAELDGDELVINGQKIWTSFADIADWQELLVRTDLDAPRHRGLTWLICDMRSTGIEIRPIETMSRDRDFCEVYYDDVRVPVSNVVGGINDGWSVAMSTLSFERGTAFTLSQVRLSRVVEDLIELARTRLGPDGRRPAIADDELGRRLAMARADVAALRATTYASISRNARATPPGPEGSMLKLYYSDLAQEVYRLAFDLLGLDALEFVSRWEIGGWSGDYLHSYAISIAGGTSEVQRNIIGEKVLGLPR